MRVLIVTQHFWPETFGINDIALSLAKNNIAVEILTAKPNYPGGIFFDGYKGVGYQMEIYNSIPVHRLPIISRGKSRWKLALNYLSFIASGLLVAPWKLRKKKFDVVFVFATSPILQAIPAIFLGWLKSAPTVLWVQDLWPESLSATGYIKCPFILKSVECTVRFIYRHTHLILVQSEAFIEPIRRLAPDSHVIFHPNSADKTFQQRSNVQLPSISGLKKNFPIIFAGNIGHAQAIEVIVDAALHLVDYSDIHFVILGTGSKKKWLLQEIKKHDLHNIELAGYFPITLMPGLMRQASALLVTLADQEIFEFTIPSKIQAYLAVGKPILASLNGEGARVVSEADAGLVAPAEDGEQLAKAILKLYSLSNEQRDEMGKNGYIYYTTHFCHDMLMARLVQHLQSIHTIKT